MKKQPASSAMALDDPRRGAVHRGQHRQAAGAAAALASEGVISMNNDHITAELDQSDDNILNNEISDETLEAAGSTHIEGQAMTIGPTIMMGGCC
jgi:hypothetical protein